jgi:hypothetical protein
LDKDLSSTIGKGQFLMEKADTEMRNWHPELPVNPEFPVNPGYPVNPEFPVNLELPVNPEMHQVNPEFPVNPEIHLVNPEFQVNPEIRQVLPEFPVHPEINLVMPDTVFGSTDKGRSRAALDDGDKMFRDQSYKTSYGCNFKKSIIS